MMCVRDVVKTGSPSTSNCPLRTISQQAYLASIAMITTGHVCVHTPSNIQQSIKEKHSENPPPQLHFYSSSSFCSITTLPASLRDSRLLHSPGRSTLLYCRRPRCSEPGLIRLHHLFNNSKYRSVSERFTPLCRWDQNAHVFFCIAPFFHTFHM